METKTVEKEIKKKRITWKLIGQSFLYFVLMIIAGAFTGGFGSLVVIAIGLWKFRKQTVVALVFMMLPLLIISFVSSDESFNEQMVRLEHERAVKKKEKLSQEAAQASEQSEKKEYWLKLKSPTTKSKGSNFQARLNCYNNASTDCESSYDFDSCYELREALCRELLLPK